MPSWTRQKPAVLTAQRIPAPHAAILGAYAHEKGAFSSFGLISSDFDHALYTALDEATKAAPVSVIHTRSLYGGAAAPSGPLSGEAIGILAGEDDAVIGEGLKAAVYNLEQRLWYGVTDGSVRVRFFAYTISSVGHHLSKGAGIEPGAALAYLMAPPVESIVALDAALKAADVRVAKLFTPPTETNFGGAYLTGPLEACEAAAAAFADKVASIAFDPLPKLEPFAYGRRTR